MGETQKIFDMWMACHTQDEIAEATGSKQQTVGDEIATFTEIGNVSNFGKSLDFTRDNEFQPPLYNLWTFAKKTNGVSHFGNSEQRIVDNLLYLYTEPFDNTAPSRMGNTNALQSLSVLFPNTPQPRGEYN